MARLLMANPHLGIPTKAGRTKGLPGRWFASNRSLAGALLLTSLLGLSHPLEARAANDEQLMRLLQRGSCPGCKLQDADLVQADLRDADLRRARLQRANLSGAMLDGARLSGADLSFTSLKGASLRGADLRGARLEGTDLRSSDLSGAQIDPGALSRAHWSQARGLGPGNLSYAQLHNAGVEASQSGNAPKAEDFFNQAISQRPDAAISWLARGIVRNEQGKTALAAQDFRYAAALYGQQGEEQTAKKLTEAAIAMEKPARKPKGGNGTGSAFLEGTSSLIQGLAPIALKLLPLMLL